MTLSSKASSASKLTKSAVVVTAAAAGAASLLAPGMAAQAATDAATVVKLSYSDKLFVVANGSTSPINFDQWRATNFSTPRTVGSIPGSQYIKFGTTDDVIAMVPGVAPHTLTFNQWLAAGAPRPTEIGNEGFIKLSWAPEIARMTNLATGAGYPLSKAEWKVNGFPRFAVQQRIKGDQFYRNAGSDAVYYAGPGVNRQISFNEWIAAGAPTPSVRGTVASTASSNTSNTDSAIVNIARKYIGVPYVWGGSTPSGFDCSGLTSYVYRQVGISLPRTSQSQWYNGRTISQSQARPGDLVILNGGGHVGIYVGGNTFIDAPKPGRSVIEREIWATPTFVTYR